MIVNIEKPPDRRCEFESRLLRDDKRNSYINIPGPRSGAEVSLRHEG